MSWRGRFVGLVQLHMVVGLTGFLRMSDNLFGCVILNLLGSSKVVF